MKTGIAIACIGAALLAGCKSTEAFMQQQPDATFLSKVPPKDLAFCIADKEHAAQWQNDDGSYSIKVPTMYGGSGLGFTVRADASGTVVEYRKAKGLPDIKAPWKKCLAG